MKTHINESKTEKIVDKLLEEKGFTKSNGILIEPRRSENPFIDKALSKSSKKGTGERGEPEHIITELGINDLVIITEIKGDEKFHESANRDKPVDYAIDGVMHYMSFLSKDFNVIGIAISGKSKDNLKISSFFLPKGVKSLSDIREIESNELLTLRNYKNIIRNDHEYSKMKRAELVSFSREIHNDLRDYIKLAENEKPLLIGAILLAMESSGFNNSYRDYIKDKSLASQICSHVDVILEESGVPETKRNTMKKVYEFINIHPEINKENCLPLNDELRLALDQKTQNKIREEAKEALLEFKRYRPLLYIVHKLEEKILPLMKIDGGYDVLGEFYGEFLRYTGGDKKALGIVLTPKHITELFAHLADISPGDRLLDTCTGTGGFPISNINYLLDKAGDDEDLKDSIRNSTIVAIEQQPHMFTLCMFNMLLRGIDTEHVLLQNSFNIKSTLTSLNCRVGNLNPPYNQKGEDLHELEYIKLNLDCLVQGGIGIAIVPVSCATGNTHLKERLLKSHTLEAVMSMPDSLFDPVGIVTCIMIFKAKQPHPKGYKTWFGYWKDDGFIKTKTHGRYDINNQWNKIKESWINMYRYKREIKGTSILHSITKDDEWLAEPYLETDYSKVNKSVFEEALKNYSIFKITHQGGNE
jgi:Type I restriction-modification system methyltransferase subunit